MKIMITQITFIDCLMITFNNALFIRDKTLLVLVLNKETKV